MRENRTNHKADPRTGEPLGAGPGSAVVPEATDGAVRRLRDENEGLRLRLQAAEEVLEDLGGRSQEASEVPVFRRSPDNRYSSPTGSSTPPR